MSIIISSFKDVTFNVTKYSANYEDIELLFLYYCVRLRLNCEAKCFYGLLGQTKLMSNFFSKQICT